MRQCRKCEQWDPHCGFRPQSRICKKCEAARRKEREAKPVPVADYQRREYKAEFISPKTDPVAPCSPCEVCDGTGEYEGDPCFECGTSPPPKADPYAGMGAGERRRAELRAMGAISVTEMAAAASNGTSPQSSGDKGEQDDGPRDEGVSADRQPRSSQAGMEGVQDRRGIHLERRGVQGPKDHQEGLGAQAVEVTPAGVTPVVLPGQAQPSQSSGQAEDTKPRVEVAPVKVEETRQPPAGKLPDAASARGEDFDIDEQFEEQIDLEHLSDDDKTARIAAIVPEVARANGVEPCDVTWADYAKYTGYAWGESTFGIARRHITRVGGFNAIRDAFYPGTATDFAVERKELHDLATTNREAARRETRDALFLRQAEEVATRSMRGIIPAEGWAKKFSDGFEGNRIVTCLWSDDHFDPECGLEGFDEVGQTRRAAAIAEQHVTYKPQYRDQTSARMVVNGDEIEGWLHGKHGAHPSVQVCSAIWKIAQAAGYVAANYRELFLDFIPGNHDRDTAFDPKRAIQDKQYGYMTVIAFGVKMALSNLKNVRLRLCAPEAYFDHFGEKGMATHGDTLFGKVTPRKLDTSVVEYVINRFNASRGGFGPVKLVLLGHWHTGLTRHLDNGVTVVVNGALTPSNEFARSIDAFEANCGHFIFESVPKYIFGDSRFVRVGLEDSRSAALDGLIKPFEPFNTKPEAA